MKKRLFSVSLNERQKVMLVVTAVIVVIALVLEQWTFPAYDRWREQASLLRAKAAMYGRLSRNFQIKDRVDRQYGQLGTNAFRVESDEIIFADFLKRLETAAGGLLVKVEPSPVKNEGVYATYRVRLLLSGKLQEIVRFADEITRGENAVGIESFMLRAIPGRNMCDCTFIMWMVRLSSQQAKERHSTNVSATTTAPVTKESVGTR